LLAPRDEDGHNRCAMSLASKVAKKLLPKSAKRFILLRFRGVHRRYEHLRSHPSRIFLEREILPWIAAHYSRVLFVGTAPYTHQFERIFRRSRDQYTTIDPVRGTEIWGARHHIVAPLQEIGLHRTKGHFDCVVLNGIFGFGIDDIESQREAIKILHDTIAPGGLLLVGWNTNLMLDLEDLGLFEPYFSDTVEGLPWPHRTRFPLPETHTYDFYTRRAD
jgi:hypothetical protein